MPAQLQPSTSGPSPNASTGPSAPVPFSPPSAAFWAAQASCADDKQVKCAQDYICDPGRDRCVHREELRASCSDPYDCKSGVCATSTSETPDALTCQPPPAPGDMCFYESGCSAAGNRPGAGTIILLALFAVVAIVRARRTQARRA